MILFEYSRHPFPYKITLLKTLAQVRNAHANESKITYLIATKEVICTRDLLECYFLKKLKIRIVALLSRQPLVKGERLVRNELSAAMLSRIARWYL